VESQQAQHRPGPKTEAGKETARKLISTADVVIENFRPGVMDRLGLGAAAMTEPIRVLSIARCPIRRG
jgi:hypothetical protein